MPTTNQVQTTEFERERYAKSAKTPTIVDQWERSRYVEAQILAATDDMNLLFNHFFKDKCTDAFSITDHGGELLEQALNARKDHPEIIIPANIWNNHWVLLTVKIVDSRVQVTCWDPHEEPKEQKENKVKAILDTVVKKVYPGQDAEVKYIYADIEDAQDKDDAYSCGARVFRQALIDSKIENDLTRTQSNNPSDLNIQFVKCLITVSENSKKSPEQLEALSDQNIATIQTTNPSDSAVSLPVVTGENFPIICASDVPSTQRAKFQTKQDEYLAVYLQEAYLNDLDDQSAIDYAKQKLSKATKDVVEESKKSVIDLMVKNGLFKSVKTESPKPVGTQSSKPGLG